MKILGILFLFAFPINLSAQLYVARSVGQDFGLFDDISNGNLNKESYNGNPYLHEEWRNIAVTTVSGEEVLFKKAKLDIWQHVLIVNKEGLDKTANNYLIAVIEFDKGTIKGESFMKIGVNNELRFAKFLKKGRINRGYMTYGPKVKRGYKKRSITKIEKKKSNLIDELHWSVAKNMCKDNDDIFYGDIKSHGIVKHKKNKTLNTTMNELKFCLFKQRLIHKSLKLGMKVFEINESYISKTCSTCGTIYDVKKVKRLFMSK